MPTPARIDALASRLEAPLLVTRAPNLRYLIGYTGSNGYLLVRPGGGGAFLTDGRYGESAAPLLEAFPHFDLRVYTGDLWKALGDLLAGLERVQVEAAGVTWEFARGLEEKAGVAPIPAAAGVEDLRRAKEEPELAALRTAAAAGDAAFAALGELLGRAAREADLAWELVAEMRRHGGERADWEAIVAAGPAASIPHYETGPAPLGSGLLLLDYGCVVDGYHSDMSRTVWLEGPADPLMRQVYGVVLEAEEAGIVACRPGATGHEVDEAARAVLRAAGYEEQFLHSTGHGVGLEIHEPPWLRRGNEDPLRVGDVVTVEPGVYLPGVGGVRIEDMVLVTESGPEILTGSRRELERP
ncbi:MAG: aminopeptidase P family protein [Acidimicrobiia bacterium]|nr:aminopeptidase P family protein [Acidimicrobiia bacterium]